MERSPGDHGNLGQNSGTATSDQGVFETASDLESIYEAPNESSTKPLDVPRTEPASWAPRDWMQLTLIGGLLLLLVASLFTSGELPGELLTIFTIMVGYFFGKKAGPAK